MLLVFGLSFVVELAYATYTIFVSRGYRWQAVVSSALIALLKTFLVYRVVFSIETLPALVIGQAIGTFVTMSFLPNKARSGLAGTARLESEVSQPANR